MIVGEVADLWKQRCMCYFNALYMKKIEKDGWAVRYLKDGMD